MLQQIGIRNVFSKHRDTSIVHFQVLFKEATAAAAAAACCMLASWGNLGRVGGIQRVTRPPFNPILARISVV